MRKIAGTLLVILCFVAVAFFLKGSRPFAPPTPLPIENRIPQLEQRLAGAKNVIEQAVAAYVPQSNAQIGDLSAPANDILEGLPSVVLVEALVKPEKPTGRIIHLRDWHFVPKDLYVLDMNEVYGRELTAEEIDQLHRELLLEVEIVQLEQMALLRCLIKHHGLRRVHSEGAGSDSKTSPAT